MDIVTNIMPRAPRGKIFQRDGLVRQKHKMKIRRGKCGNRVRRGKARWELHGKERVDKVERGRERSEKGKQESDRAEQQEVERGL